VAVTDTARCFVALRPGPLAQARLDRALARLERDAGRDAGVRWVRPGRAHVTLAFLGDVARSALPRVQAALAEVAFAPLRLGLAGTGQFPPRGRARVLWAGVSGDLDRLGALAGRIAEQLARVGVQLEARPFHPHVTLGRVRPRGRRGGGEALASQLAAAAGELTSEPETVASFELCESELGPDGAEHRCLSVVPAQGSP
jgi:2'-5' RNA ligase